MLWPGLFRTKDYVLTSLSCFMDMKFVYEMHKNNESYEKILSRIISGKDLKPEIQKFNIVKPDWLVSKGKELPYPWHNGRIPSYGLPVWRSRDLNPCSF